MEWLFWTGVIACALVLGFVLYEIGEAYIGRQNFRRRKPKASTYVFDDNSNQPNRDYFGKAIIKWIEPHMNGTGLETYHLFNMDRGHFTREYFPYEMQEISLPGAKITHYQARINAQSNQIVADHYTKQKLYRENLLHQMATRNIIKETLEDVKEVLKAQKSPINKKNQTEEE